MEEPGTKPLWNRLMWPLFIAMIGCFWAWIGYLMVYVM